MARPTLMTHRKFRRVARALGSPLIARGALEILWDFCYETGDPYVGTAEDIEAVVGWTGTAGQLTEALATAGEPEGLGFIEPVSAAAAGARTYQVHDLWHHAPDYVAKRRKRELARLGRVDPALDRHAAPDGAGCSETADCQIDIDRTPARALAPALAPARALETDSPVLSLFPTVGKGGPEWRFRKRQLDEWQATYPNLDVLAECRKALAWLNANPGRRKTTRGMPQFLVNWLNRATDHRGGAYAGPAAKSSGNVEAGRRFVARGSDQ